MTQLAGYGRLGKDPVRRTTKDSKLMVTASLALDVDRLTDDRQPAPWWLNLIAFGAQAESLERHESGEMISVAGPLKRSYWTNQDGEVRESWGVLVESNGCQMEYETVLCRVDSPIGEGASLSGRARPRAGAPIQRLRLRAE